MKKLFKVSIPLFIFILIFNSCASVKSENPDDILSKKIIGTWSAIKGTETISFTSDGKYIDTIFLKLTGYDEILFPEYILDGEYRIKNQLVEFLSVNIKYLYHAESKLKNSFEIKLFPRSVRILDDGDLIMQTIHLVDLIEGKNEEIEGKWESKYLTLQFFRNSEFQFKNGFVTDEYNFKKDSLTLIRNFHFDSDFRSKPFTTYYTLRNKVIIADSLFTVASVFQENSMLWFIKDPVIYRKID